MSLAGALFRLLGSNWRSGSIDAPSSSISSTIPFGRVPVIQKCTILRCVHSRLLGTASHLKHLIKVKGHSRTGSPSGLRRGGRVLGSSVRSGSGRENTGALLGHRKQEARQGLASVQSIRGIHIEWKEQISALTARHVVVRANLDTIPQVEKVATGFPQIGG